MRKPIFLAAVILVVSTLAAWHSASAEIPPIPRVLPPEGLEIPADVRERLETRIAETRERLAKRLFPGIRPDVEVYLKAVELALQHREFYVPKDFEKADWALDQANQCLDWMDKGETPWDTATGLVVRGYISSIDGSVQPYGLVIPKDHDFTKPCPLYIWLHGRGDKNTDLHFLHERAAKTGQIAPPGAIVLHPFGRHCVGWKHAGEIDILEAATSALHHYQIDPQRIVLIGFSMGGAGAWHLGAHYADHWIAVSPGAGFAETARYQRLTPDKYPPEYEQKLWGLYDVPGYVRDLFNTRVIAYSGELDKQIQAARIMEEAYQTEGRTLEHLIGPGVEHKYEPKTLERLLAQLRSIVETTDIQQVHEPEEVHLQTRTLRYPTQKWITAEGLEEHWQDARIDGRRSGQSVSVTTKNVSALSFAFPARWKSLNVTIDGQELGKPLHDKGLVLQRTTGDQIIYPPGGAAKQDGKWRWVSSGEMHLPLRKRRLLQGPIDDAFMGRFLIVTPSGESNREFQMWCNFELDHFLDRWRALMRGEPRVKTDRDVTLADLEENQHLILWGDPSTNVVMHWLLKDSPLEFEIRPSPLVKPIGTWKFGGQSYDSDRFVPSLIYPRKDADGHYNGYVVFNSGLTFREGHDRTNSLQNPKLPDWAIIDITQPPDAFSPGRIHDAGFFDEEWKLKGPVKGP